MPELEEEIFNPGPPPQGFEFIWEVFQDLTRARASGFTACAISFVDIAAWGSLNKIRLRVWEVDLLRSLDETWMDVMTENVKSERRKREQDQKAKPG